MRKLASLFVALAVAAGALVYGAVGHGVKLAAKPDNPTVYPTGWSWGD